MALEVVWAYGSAIWPGIKGLGLILTPSFCPLSVFLATLCAVCLDGPVLEGRAVPFPRAFLGLLRGARLPHPPAGGHEPGWPLPLPLWAVEHQEFSAGLAGPADSWMSSGVTRERSWVGAEPAPLEPL